METKCSLNRCQKAHRRSSIVEICTKQTWHGHAERHQADHGAKSSTVPHRRPFKPHKPQRSAPMLLRWFPLPSRCRLSPAAAIIRQMSRMDPLWLMVPLSLYVLAFALFVRRYRDWLILHLSPPEIRLLENREERRRAAGSMERTFYKDRRNWFSISMFALGVAFVSLGCVMTCALILRGPWSNIGLGVALILTLIVIPVLAQAFDFYWHRKRRSKYLRKYLNEHGVPICMPCGYDLRGQVDPYCPECGTPFVRHSENA